MLIFLQIFFSVIVCTERQIVFLNKMLAASAGTWESRMLEIEIGPERVQFGHRSSRKQMSRTKKTVDIVRACWYVFQCKSCLSVQYLLGPGPRMRSLKLGDVCLF